MPYIAATTDPGAALSGLAGALFPDPSKLGHAQLYGAQAGLAGAQQRESEVKTSDLERAARIRQTLPDVIANFQRDPSAGAAALVASAGALNIPVAQLFGGGLAANSLSPNAVSIPAQDQAASLSGAQAFSGSQTADARKNTTAITTANIAAAPALTTAQQGVRAYNETRRPFINDKGETAYAGPGQDPPAGFYPADQAQGVRAGNLARDVANANTKPFVVQDPTAANGYRITHVASTQQPPPGAVPYDPANSLHTAASVSLYDPPAPAAARGAPAAPVAPVAPQAGVLPGEPMPAGAATPVAAPAAPAAPTLPPPALSDMMAGGPTTTPAPGATPTGQRSGVFDQAAQSVGLNPAGTHPPDPKTNTDNEEWIDQQAAELAAGRQKGWSHLLEKDMTLAPEAKQAIIKRMNDLFARNEVDPATKRMGNTRNNWSAARNQAWQEAAGKLKSEPTNSIAEVFGLNDKRSHMTLPGASAPIPGAAAPVPGAAPTAPAPQPGGMAPPAPPIADPSGLSAVFTGAAPGAAQAAPAAPQAAPAPAQAAPAPPQAAQRPATPAVPPAPQRIPGQVYVMPNGHPMVWGRNGMWLPQPETSRVEAQ